MEEEGRGKERETGEIKVLSLKERRRIWQGHLGKINTACGFRDDS